MVEVSQKRSWRGSPTARGSPASGVGKVPSDKSFMQDVWDRMEIGLPRAELGLPRVEGRGGRSPAPSSRASAVRTPTASAACSRSSSQGPKPRFQLPFWLAVAAPIICCFSAVCTARLVWGLVQYEHIEARANSAFDRATKSQEELSTDLLKDNTELIYSLVLRKIRDEVKQYVVELPDRAVDGLWTNMLTRKKYVGQFDDANWTDRWEAGFAMWREISSHNPRRPDLIERADGLMLAYQTQAFSAVLPNRTGENENESPEHPRRSWSWYESPPASGDTVNLAVWPIDGAGDLMEPPRNLVEANKITEKAFYQTQERLRQQNPDGPLEQAWSEIYELYGRQVVISWTSPVAYCGNYSCMEGVIAASFTLASLNRWCHNTWRELEQNAERPMHANNSAIFVVQQDSEDSGDSRGWQGYLIGASSVIQATDMDSLQMANASDNDIIRNTSQAILRKYTGWNNATALWDEAPPFAFKMQPHGLEVFEEYSPLNDEGLSEVATLSVPLDHRTRWLVVLVLPVGAFSSTLSVAQQNMEAKVTEAGDRLKNQFGTLHVFNMVVFAVGVVCSFVLGLGLSAWVSRDLQTLSRYMRKISQLDFMDDSKEFETLRSGRRSVIKDVCEMQDAFCRLALSVQAFARFVPETVVRNIVRGNKPRHLRPYVDKCEVTAMFSDIKNFTTIAETLSERDLLLVLVKYLTVMTQLVEESFGGIVAEILGDGVLAFWNTPDRVEGHAAKACSAALAMQEAMVSLNAELEAMDPPLPQLSIRIGLHTGMVLTGNLGSTTKMKFGCMGDAVNLASRVEGLCKTYEMPILCSGETRKSADGICCRPLDLVQVKGKKEPTLVCEVLGRDGPVPSGEPCQPVLSAEQQQLFQIYEQALQAYHKADFARAEELTQRFLAQRPEDKAAKGLLERAKRHSGTLTEQEILDWTGVVVMMDK